MRDLNSARDKILSRMSKDSETGCWNWTAGKDGNGYGALYIEDKYWKAHRASFTAFKRAIDPGMFICHKCDNPSCVNPDHLFSGTPGDNTRDASRKGRISHGERHHAAKLSESQVKEIFESSAPQSELAKRYRVDVQLIERIKRGIKWRRTTRGLRRGTADDRRLSADDRAAVRAASGTQREIAERFGISQAHVSRIRSGRAYAGPERVK